MCDLSEIKKKVTWAEFHKGKLKRKVVAATYNSLHLPGLVTQFVPSFKVNTKLYKGGKFVKKLQCCFGERVKQSNLVLSTELMK